MFVHIYEDIITHNLFIKINTFAFALALALACSECVLSLSSECH